MQEFDWEIRRLLGFRNKLPAKLQAMLRNISDIRRLSWFLLNTDCVRFYVDLLDLQTADTDNGASSFSIFKYADDETHALITRLSILAK